MDISQSPEGPNRTERQRKGDALTIEVQGYWDSRLWYLGLMLGVIPLAFLVLQFVDGRVWDLPASITVRAYFCNKYCHVYVYICIYTHTICHKRTIYMHVCVCVCVCSWYLRCVQLWNPMDCSPPGSSVHEILWARILELGCHLLLQGIFLTQEENLSLLYCRWIFFLTVWATREARVCMCVCVCVCVCVYLSPIILSVLFL